jgi:hypothetical protein
MRVLTALGTRIAFTTAQGIMPAYSDVLKAGKNEMFNTSRRNRYDYQRFYRSNKP